MTFVTLIGRKNSDFRRSVRFRSRSFFLLSLMMMAEDSFIHSTDTFILDRTDNLAIMMIKLGGLRPCLALLTLISLLDPACGWGTVGHEMVANLAYHRLTNETKQAIQGILGPSNDTSAGSPLAAVADWADQVRYHYHWSAALHYIDIPDDRLDGGCPSMAPNGTSACNFVYKRDCVNDVCVAGAILNYTSQLTQWKLGDGLPGLRGFPFRSKLIEGYNVREALMFLTQYVYAIFENRGRRRPTLFDIRLSPVIIPVLFYSFVGDIHQPLHASRTSDKGGNDFHVHFKSSLAPTPRSGLSHHHGWNLHSVWDSGILEEAIERKYSGSRANFEEYLIEASLTGDYKDYMDHWLECSNGRNKTCTIEWGEESFEDALMWAYRNSDNEEIVDGSVLDESYYETRLPIVEQRLLAAGVRLAATLESILGGPSPSASK